MALKLINDAYMDSDEEPNSDDPASSTSPISTNDDDVSNIQRIVAESTTLTQQTGSDSLSVAVTVVSMETDQSQEPKKRYGFPQCLELTEEERVSIPEETTEPVSAELERKVSELINKQHRQNLDINYEIQNRKEFRNPSIYQKLIEHCEIDEFGSNFSAEDFDPNRWDESASVEALAKAQSTFMEKYERERKLKGPTDAAGIKRKTKWDKEPAAKINPLALRPPVSGATKILSTGNLTRTTK